MTEDEWYAKGDARFTAWANMFYVRTGELVTIDEEAGYMRGWVEAGREMGIVE